MVINGEGWYKTVRNDEDGEGRRGTVRDYSATMKKR
jgi:hypothetical protein